MAEHIGLLDAARKTAAENADNKGVFAVVTPFGTMAIVDRSKPAAGDAGKMTAVAPERPGKGPVLASRRNRALILGK